MMQSREQYRCDQFKINDELTSLACEKSFFDEDTARGACAYSRAISVLNTITDAMHVVQGPLECVTCATYAWNARGSISSQPILHAKQDKIFFDNLGLSAQVMRELAAACKPQAIFVYSTCITETMGYDISEVCESVAKDLRIPVIPVDSMSFKAEKGYEAACNALLRLIGSRSYKPISPYSVNILGDYNIAGDLWPIRSYFEELGIEVVSTITGDSRVAEIQRAHCADLNLVQCSSSIGSLARRLEEKYGIPYRSVSFLGIEETSSALRTAAEFFENPGIIEESERMIAGETIRISRKIEHYKTKFAGQRAAIFLNGASKAASLIKALKELGIEVVIVGIRDGNWVDRQRIRNFIGRDAVDADKLNPGDLGEMLSKGNVGLIIPGAEDQPVIRKLNIPICDICHNRTSTFEGFDGMVNFAREIDIAINNRIEKPPARKKKTGGRPPCMAQKRGRSEPVEKQKKASFKKHTSIIAQRVL
ncbi:nitrogenase component 1 [Methanothrix sp.]|uniref:nitrogenase component 1 n=1 Tax=Methanothrix sp. TaxID=90426 RepID=UPI003BB6A071